MCSVERGICPIATSTVNELFLAHERCVCMQLYKVYRQRISMQVVHQASYLHKPRHEQRDMWWRHNGHRQTGASCHLFVKYHKGKGRYGLFVSGCTLGVQVKLWDTLRLHAIPEHLRSVITTRCYTNPRLPLPYLYLYHPLIICFAKCSRYTCDMVYSLQIQLAVEQTCWMLVQFWGPICRKS